MIIRKYKDKDIQQVASVISETFHKFNFKDNPLNSAKEYVEFYNPKSELEEIRKEFKTSTDFFIIENNGRVLGLLRAKENRIVNLFVVGDFHRKGIGKLLVERFEKECRKRKYQEIVLRSSLFAIPFYQAVGYKKTTGVRISKGLTVQPMKKKIAYEWRCV